MKHLNFVHLALFTVIVCSLRHSVDAKQDGNEKKRNSAVSKESNAESAANDKLGWPILHFDLVGEGEQVRPGTIARNHDGSVAKTLKNVSGAVWSPSGKTFAYYSQHQPNQPQTLNIESLDGKSKKNI